MNPKEVFHNTAYSVQLPYIAGHSLSVEKFFLRWVRSYIFDEKASSGMYRLIFKKEIFLSTGKKTKI